MCGDAEHMSSSLLGMGKLEYTNIIWSQLSHAKVSGYLCNNACGCLSYTFQFKLRIVSTKPSTYNMLSHELYACTNCHTSAPLITINAKTTVIQLSRAL